GHGAVEPELLADDDARHHRRATHVADQLAHELLQLCLVHPVLLATSAVGSSCDGSRAASGGDWNQGGPGARGMPKLPVWRATASRKAPSSLARTAASSRAWPPKMRAGTFSWSAAKSLSAAAASGATGSRPAMARMRIAATAPRKSRQSASWSASPSG